MMITIMSIEKPPFGWPSRRAPYAGPMISAAQLSICVYWRRCFFFTRPLESPQAVNLQRQCGGEKICMFGPGRISEIDVMEESAISRRRANSKPLSEAEFNALLAALDSDARRAGEKYEIARAGLIKIFRARGFWNEADDLADRTLDVSARRVLAKASTAEPVRNIHSYMMEIARKIASEARRQPPHLPLDESIQAGFSLDPHAAHPAQIDERKLEYLQELVQRLPAHEQTTIIEYHQYSKSQKIANRAKLARDSATSKGALRVRAYRIRRCLAKKLRERFGGNDGGGTP
jgi:hypothetical protein